ncbi:hypothetical protein A2U01_0095884, partial [Trifolium medium]|nr:hypothetical protein [Trifolium medium]
MRRLGTCGIKASCAHVVLIVMEELQSLANRCRNR